MLGQQEGLVLTSQGWLVLGSHRGRVLVVVELEASGRAKWLVLRLLYNFGSLLGL